MEFVITHNRQSMMRMPSLKGGTEPISIDYSPWTDTNGTISAVTVSLKSGTATIANESLSGSTKSFTLTTAQTGAAVLELKATAGNNEHISNIYTLTKDYTSNTEDYGLCLS